MNLEQIRLQSANASSEYCHDCPRHPSFGNTVYAEGCKKHQIQLNPKILFLWRDPSSPKNDNVIGCSNDSNVCPWCHTDNSANNFREEIYPELVRLVPELNKNSSGVYPVYCLNSVFHGPEENSTPPAKAIQCCSNVVNIFISQLKPKIVVALGLEAQKSLKWIAGINTKKMEKPVTVNSITYFWTFHPGPQSYNHKKNIIHDDMKVLANIVRKFCQ